MKLWHQRLVTFLVASVTAIGLGAYGIGIDQPIWVVLVMLAILWVAVSLAVRIGSKKLTGNSN